MGRFRSMLGTVSSNLVMSPAPKRPPVSPLRRAVEKTRTTLERRGLSETLRGRPTVSGSGEIRVMNPSGRTVYNVQVPSGTHLLLGRQLSGEPGAFHAWDDVVSGMGAFLSLVAQQAPPRASVSELTELLERGWHELESDPNWRVIWSTDRVESDNLLAAMQVWLAMKEHGLTQAPRSESGR